MNDKTIESIAKKLNVSKSMVSKVLRHCGGVDSDTRQRILTEAHGIIQRDYGECAIYFILPDIPQYFWKPVRKGIADATDPLDIPVKCNVYTKASDEATVLRYLDEAERLNARAIILAAHITPAIHQKLEKMLEGRLIILLSEYHELANTFYIGSDAYSEGYTMGKHYVSHYADRKFIMFTRPGNYNIEKRVEGFRQAVNEVIPDLMDKALCIKLDDKIFKDFKLLPSKLAPLLVDAAKAHDKICIYSPMGLPQFPLAIIKAKLTDKTVCLCNDCYLDHPHHEKNPNTGFVVTCNQDGYEQGMIASKMASDFVRDGLYPENKKTYIPSHLDVSIKYSDAI